MLVLGPLRPAGDEVRQSEPSRRLSMLRDQPVRAANGLPADLASLEVLADVVQVQARRWACSGGPTIPASARRTRSPRREPFSASRRTRVRRDSSTSWIIARAASLARAAPGSRGGAAVGATTAARSGSASVLPQRAGPSRHRAERYRRTRCREPQAARVRSEHRRPSRMPTYLSPGVYVEEVEAGSRPIEGVGTAVAAFVGLAARGPTNTPTLVTNWSQFVSAFGDFMEGAYLAHAVYGYFLNGGGAVLRRAHRRRRARGDGPRRDRHRRRTPSSAATASGPRGRARRQPDHGRGHRGHDRCRGHLQADGPRPGQARGGLRRPVHEAWQEQRRDGHQGAVQAHHRRGGRPGRHRARPRARPRHPGGRRERQADAPDPDDYVGDSRRPDRLRRPRGGRRGHDARRPRPDGLYQKGIIDARGAPGRAGGDDRPLRADGRPRRHPRRAARPQRPAGQGVARRQGRLRLQVRDPVLAVGQGPRPAHGQGRVRAAERPRRRRLGTQRRHARRPQGARQRGHPRRARPWS